jgi:hypothetical protein
MKNAAKVAQTIKAQKPSKNPQGTTTSIDYAVLTDAIMGAALSRRAALYAEMSVALIHFTQEPEGTDATGKAHLKDVYSNAGYFCLAKSDRDYKTVNRRLNAMAKLFDKLGSSLVYSWIDGKGDTASMLAYVQTELLAYNFQCLDDIHDYVGVTTAKTRAPRQPVAAPVTVTVPNSGPEQEEEEEEAPAPAAFDAAQVRAEMMANMSPDAIREFCAQMLADVAALEQAQIDAETAAAAAAPAAAAAAAPAAVVPMNSKARKQAKKQAHIAAQQQAQQQQQRAAA